ncbi:hypothetical protein BH10BAC5_BH10BAC5_18770 [soil metagenome]
MDMKLVYGLIPNSGSLEQYIENKAKELAEKIVRRTSATMILEDQEVSSSVIANAIRERTEIYKKQIPKILWD